MAYLLNPRWGILAPSVALLVALVSLAALAAPAAAQRLPDAVRSALRVHPDVQSAAANLRALVQTYDQAGAGRYPTVDLRGAVGREQADNPNTRFQQQGDSFQSRSEANLTLRQNLFDGSQVRSQMETQSYRVDAARSRLSDTADQVAFRVCEAYLDALRDDQQVALSKLNVSRHEAALEKVGYRAKSGVGQRADVEQAEARLALARSNLVSALGSQRDSAARFERVVGRPPSSLQQPESQQKAIPPVIESAKWVASNNSYAIKSAQSDRNAAEATVRTARSEFAPKVDAELSANRNRDLGGIPGQVNDNTAMLVMRYNLFRGGADQARVREAMERETIAMEAVRNAQQAVDENVARSWHALVTARDRLAFLQGHAQATERVLDAYTSQFELGRRSLLDVLNAENELFQARAALTAGSAAALLGEYRLLAAMGILVESLGLSGEIGNLDARIEK